MNNKIGDKTMRTQLSKLALAAAFGLALTFTFSCSSDDDGGGGGNSGGGTCNGSSGINGGNGKGNNIANYKTKRIGDQVWMAENLNYNVTGSRCYGECGQVFVGMNENEEPIMATLSNTEIKANCEKYGRLYDWATAMANSASSFASPSGVRGVCPSGWHLPSGNEWKKLTDFIGGTFGTDTKLKATSGWNSYNEESGEKKGNGTDNYGFSALPGGYSFSFPSGYFANVGETGDWWTATEYDTNQAYRRVIGIRYNSVLSVQFDKKDLVSVRCVQD